MTTPRHRRQHQRLATIALQANRLTSLLAEAHTAAELTLRDGYPGGGTEPVSGGDTSNPTLGAVLEHEHVLESREGDTEARVVGFAAVDTSLTVIESALREIHAELSTITTRMHAGREERRTNMEACAACERLVANTPNDRLRKGYCDACRKAWARKQDEWVGPGAPDRVQFERGRRGIDTTPTVRVDPTSTHSNRIDLTVAAVTVTLPDDLAAEYLALTHPTHEDLERLHREAAARLP